MTELLVHDGKTISSIEIAQLSNKQHGHVMRDIRALLDQGVDESNFGLVNYRDGKGESRPCYQLTKKGSLILASGYDALLREKIVNRWEELELQAQFALPQTFSQALMLAAKQAEKIELQQQQLAYQAPKVEYYDKALSSESLFTTNSIAQCLDLTAIELNKRLNKIGVQYKQGDVWLIASKYRDEGFSKIVNIAIEHHDNSITSYPHLKWTEKGKEFILSLRAQGKI